LIIRFQVNTALWKYYYATGLRNEKACFALNKYTIFINIELKDPLNYKIGIQYLTACG
jgi:hypothetical protein